MSGNITVCVVNVNVNNFMLVVDKNKVFCYDMCMIPLIEKGFVGICMYLSCITAL